MAANQSMITSNATAQTANTPLAQGAGGTVMTKEKDSKEAATATKFGDVLQRMQAQYGAKAEKPREIKKTLGKDDFLRIMITQMKNQDPSNPFKAEQMATEMAQFTSVEQLHNLNSNFQKFAGQNQPLERMAMTQLIGKTVFIDKDRFPHDEGKTEALSFILPRNSKTTQVHVVNEAGETVFKKDMGEQGAGVVQFSWDGTNLTNQQTKGGNYQIKVEATDARGGTIQLANQAKSRVLGVSFEGTEPVLLIGDMNRPEKITIRNVIRVEEGGMAAAPQMPQQQQQIPPALLQALAAQQGGAQALAQQPQQRPQQQPQTVQGIEPVMNGTKPQSYFLWQKGHESVPVDQSALPPEMAQALTKYEQSRGEATAQGFPSGLGDPEQQKVEVSAQQEERPSAAMIQQAIGELQGQQPQQQRLQVSMAPSERPAPAAGSNRPGAPNEMGVDANKSFPFAKHQANSRGGELK